MSVFTLARTTWTQVTTVASIIQARGGRAMVADSATPAANDWVLLSDGERMAVTAGRWAMALDPIGPGLGATIIVAQTP